MQWRRIVSGLCGLVMVTAAVAAPYPPLRVVWEVQGEGGFYAPPTIVGDTLYASAVDGGAMAIERATGRVKWTHKLPVQVYSGVAVADGRAYVAGLDKNLYCLNAATGQVIWQKELDGVVYASPVCAGGAVVIGTGDGRTVYCFDAATGAERWTFPLGARLGSGLVIVDGVVYAGSYDAHLYALDLQTARLRWQYVAPGMIDSMPLVAGNFVYLKLPNDAVFALNKTTGEVVWQAAGKGAIPEEPTNWSTLTRAGDTLVFGTADGRLRGLDAATGAARWTIDATAPVATAPLVVGELAYVGAKDGTLSVLELATRETLFTWQPRNLQAPALLSGIMWPPVADGARLYVSSMDGRLYCFEGLPDKAAWEKARAERAAQAERLKAMTGSNVVPSDAEVDAVVALGQRVKGFVVWESNRDGAWDLFRLNSDGSGFKKLTTFAATRNPLAWDGYLRPQVSPDGQKVLFASGKKGAAPECWLVSASGGDAAKVCAGAPLNWSATGNSFYFVRDSKIWERLVGTGQEQLVAQTQLPVTGTETSMVGQLRADRKAVVFRGGRNEYLLLDTGRTVKTTGGCEPGFTADGRCMYWVGGPKNFRLWNIATDEETQLLGQPPSEPYNYTYFPQLSYDQRWLAYGASPGQHSHDTSDYEIFVQELRQLQPVGEPVRLSWHPKTDRWPFFWVGR